VLIAYNSDPFTTFLEMGSSNEPWSLEAKLGLVAVILMLFPLLKNVLEKWQTKQCDQDLARGVHVNVNINQYTNQFVFDPSVTRQRGAGRGSRLSEQFRLPDAGW
jgi:hypothetical protein